MKVSKNQIANGKLEKIGFFNSYATQFDKDAKYNAERVWPYLNSFVPKPDIGQDQFWGGLGRPGHFVPAGGSADIFIHLAQDQVYSLINYKISVCSPQPDIGDGTEAGTLTSLNLITGEIVGLGTNFTAIFGQTNSPSNPFIAGSMLQYVTTDATVNNFAFAPIARVVNDTSMFLDVGAVPLHTLNGGQAWTKAGCVYFETDGTFTPVLPGAASPVPKNTFKYLNLVEKIHTEFITKSNRALNLTGGLQTGMLRAQVPQAIKQSTLQGTDKNGLGQLRIPYLNPREGTLMLRVTNRYTKDVFVSGHVFGYKIALHGGV